MLRFCYHWIINWKKKNKKHVQNMVFLEGKNIKVLKTKGKHKKSRGLEYLWKLVIPNCIICGHDN